MDYTKFSGTYTVRRLLRDDIPYDGKRPARNRRRKLNHHRSVCLSGAMGLSIHSFGLCGWKRTKQIVLAEESIHRHRLERSYKRLHRRCDESFLDKSVNQNAEKTDQEYTNCIHTAKRPLELKIESSGLNWQKLEKRGLFYSPIFHITCIIRNLCH